MTKIRKRKSTSDDPHQQPVECRGASDEDPAILKARIEECEGRIEERDRRIEECDRRIAELQDKLLSGEEVRRALHNHIQELRGNIRVYVRTRPILPTDGIAERHSSINILPDGEITILGKHVGEVHKFKFDKVFAPSTGQDMVFEEVSKFVQSTLDGYHVCLFSYGQTGSGKTHTMQGSGNGPSFLDVEEPSAVSTDNSSHLSSPTSPNLAFTLPQMATKINPFPHQLTQQAARNVEEVNRRNESLEAENC